MAKSNSEPPVLTEEERALRREFEETVGYWNDNLTYWLAVDPDLFEQFLEFASHVHSKDNLSPREKSLIKLGVAASPTHLNRGEVRQHMRMAFEREASAREVQEVLELVSPIGIHSVIEGIPYVIDEFGLPEETEEMAAVKEHFMETRGYWSDFWDSVLRLDHEYLRRYTDLSGYPWTTGELDPKLREMIYVAIDVSTTHIYHQGLEQHLENAIEYGATRDELVELIELVSEQGFDTMLECMPILYEEARNYNKLE